MQAKQVLGFRRSATRSRGACTWVFSALVTGHIPKNGQANAALALERTRLQVVGYHARDRGLEQGLRCRGIWCVVQVTAEVAIREEANHQ